MTVDPYIEFGSSIDLYTSYVTGEILMFRQQLRPHDTGRAAVRMVGRRRRPASCVAPTAGESALLSSDVHQRPHVMLGAGSGGRRQADP